MRALLFVAGIVLLSGCFGGNGSRLSPASYDLGPAQPAVDSAPAGILRQIEVHAPSWLDTTAMQYRLSYADRNRRQAYAASRWVAPPARLLEQSLGQRLASGAGSLQSRTAGCRLAVELDEFVQDFETPERSQAILEARVTLQPQRGAAFLARQRFRVLQPAGAEARSGAIAMATATRQFGGDIEIWLAQISGETLKYCRLS